MKRLKIPPQLQCACLYARTEKGLGFEISRALHKVDGNVMKWLIMKIRQTCFQEDAHRTLDSMHLVINLLDASV